MECNYVRNYVRNSLCLFLSLVFSSGVFAEEELASKWVLGVAKANVSVGGDMDGTTLLSSGGSLEYLPSLDNGDGVKVSIGRVRYTCPSIILLNDAGEIIRTETDEIASVIGLGVACDALVNSDYDFMVDLSLSIANLDANFSAYPSTTARYTGFNLDYIKPFGVTKYFKPAILLGLGAGSVKVKNGSVASTIEDATYFQAVFRYGLGFHIQIGQAYFLEFMSIRYSGNYSRVEGAAGDKNLSGLKSKGSINTLGIKFVF